MHRQLPHVRAKQEAVMRRRSRKVCVAIVAISFVAVIVLPKSGNLAQTDSLEDIHPTLVLATTAGDFRGVIRILLSSAER
jgi:hypothetical protein